MIRKLAVVCERVVPKLIFFLTILAGATAMRAQQAPAQQTPPQQTTPPSQESQQSSSSQEASADETPGRHRAHPHNYKNWTYNVGGGANLPTGTTKTFVRGGGGVAAVGVARNANKYLGLRLDFQWDNLPLRSSALELAQAPGANNHVYSLMLDPIVNVPVTKLWGGYFLIGPAYYHRSGKLDSSAAVPGSACNPFFTWWGRCSNGSLPLNGNFLTSSQNEFGYNLGGGVTRKLGNRFELYGEFRYLHGSHSNITTTLRPVTVGVRW